MPRVPGTGTSGTRSTVPGTRSTTEYSVPGVLLPGKRTRYRYQVLRVPFGRSTDENSGVLVPAGYSEYMQVLPGTLYSVPVEYLLPGTGTGRPCMRRYQAAHSD